MRILCVHQGYELYGSDRSFVESVAAIRSAYPNSEIDVVLSQVGPIVPFLEPHASRLFVQPICVLRRKNMLHFATAGAAGVPRAVLRAARRMRKYDVVYVNTCVVLDYMLAARFFRGQTLLHVHEIPEGIARLVLRLLVRWSRARVIFNSKATETAFDLPRSVNARVIYNGVSGPDNPIPAGYDGSRPLRVLMLGRINRIKGQEILIDAISSLSRDYRAKLSVRIVGSAFEDIEREAMVRSLVCERALSDTIAIEPFTADPADLYRWADVVIVPSHKPESLGRVAIEAMAFARPVIASAIGGLTEIVDDGMTGWLLPPGKPGPIATVLRQIIDDPKLLTGRGALGRARYDSLFTVQATSDAIATVFKEALSALQPPRVADTIHACRLEAK